MTLVILTITSAAAMKVIDLTYPLDEFSIAWPTFPPYKFTVLNRGQTRAGFWLETNSFDTPEHKGTHVDAPAHFHKNGWRTHQIPPSRLAGPAVVVDVSAKANVDPDYLLSISDLQEWEMNYGRIPDSAVILMNSGWAYRYPDPYWVFNTNDTADTRTFHFPGIDPDAVAWLANRRDVIAMGVDTPSVDRGQAANFPTHQQIGRYSMLGIENLRNVGRLPPLGATLVIGVVNVEDGSGGPARILALIDDKCECATNLVNSASHGPPYSRRTHWD